MKRLILMGSMLGLLAGCREDSLAGEPTEDASTPPDGGIVDQTADGGLDRGEGGRPDVPVAPNEATELDSFDALTGFGAGGLVSIAAHEGKIFVGTEQGLYRAEAPEYAMRLVRGAGLDRISDVTSFDGSLFIVESDGLDGRILRSDDDGETFATTSVDGTALDYGGLQARFASNGERLLVLTDRSFVLDYDVAEASWSELPTLLPNPDAPESPIDPIINLIALDADRLYLDVSVYSSPTPGLYYADLDAPSPTWTSAGLIDAEDTGGLFAFELAGSRVLAATDSRVYERTAGEWTSILEYGAGVARDLFVASDVVLAAGANALLRSTGDGPWSSVASFGSGARVISNAFAEADGRIFWISDALRSSDDRGASWVTHASETARAEQLVVAAGTVVAEHDSRGYLAPPSETALSSLDGEADYAFYAHGDELWYCSPPDHACARRNLATGAEEVVAFPVVNGVTPISMTLVSTSVGLFGFDRSWYGTRCGSGGEAPSLRAAAGLFRFDPVASAWVRVEGIAPSRDCSGFVGIEDISVMSEAYGVLFARTRSRTYRSFDGGASFVGIDGLGSLDAVLGCGGRILAKMSDGTFLRSVDGGETFAPFAIPEADHRTTAAVSTGAICVLGLSLDAAGSTLLYSSDGETFAPIDEDFRDPVFSLAADRTTVGISSATGLYRVTFSE